MKRERSEDGGLGACPHEMKSRESKGRGKGEKKKVTYRFLATKLVTRETKDDELIWVGRGDLLVQRLEALVLGREAAFGGGVYDEDDFAFVVFEGDGGAFLCRG